MEKLFNEFELEQINATMDNVLYGLQDFIGLSFNNDNLWEIVVHVALATATNVCGVFHNEDKVDKLLEGLPENMGLWNINDYDEISERLEKQGVHTCVCVPDL